MEQGGSRANITGNRLERFVEQSLIDNGYVFIDKKKFKPALYIKQPIYSKQFFLGKGIYDSNIHCDFVLFHHEKHPDCLVIEVKWQQTSGSVDEKYPYLIENIQSKYPYKTLLLLDGGGYKKGAEKWIRAQRGNKLVGVFNMAEFQAWVNNGEL